MSRPELLSAHNYRSDGRRPTELRDIVLELGTQAQADGSALVSHGLTTVLVTVHGPREAKDPRETAHDPAVLRCASIQWRANRKERSYRQASARIH